MISLTQEQKAAVSADGHVMVSACPGSGKTRAILAKLLLLGEMVARTPRAIACITYTNAAVDEIEERLRQFGSADTVEKAHIATIHSFCLQFVVRPFAWLIPEIPTLAKILTPEMPLFRTIVDSVEDSMGRRPSFGAYDDYSAISIDTNGEPVGAGIATGVVTRDSAFLYWRTVRNRGYIDFSMIIFYAWRILTEYPFVATGLGSKFEAILVDEFQDTSVIQIEVLRTLNAIDQSNFFLVGDENQSIYGFAGARPDLARQFALDIGADTNLPFSGNFRSSRKVVNFAETLISRVPPMMALGLNRDVNIDIQYVHTASALEAITDHFLPLLTDHNIPLGRAAVLAPWWRHLVPIARRLREFDVPVFGPGARPYQRRRLFASLAEQLGACAEAPNFLGLPGVERGIFRLLVEITGETRFDVFTFDGRRTALAMIYAAREIAGAGGGGVDWLRASSAAVSQLLVDHGWATFEAVAPIPQSVEDMIADMDGQGVDLANLQISDLGLFANPDEALKLITLHNAKGRQFEAVAIVHANEGHLPHFMARTAEAIDENRRSFYVGITRAEKVLLIASDYSDRRNGPSRFLQELGLT